MWTYNHTDELCHWGIKGMKWGIRRFQNKDGSLTAAGRKRYKDSEASEPETVEQRRARTLRSTNPRELYENRDLLTTSEMRERIDRINVETQLASMAASTKKSGFDFVDRVLKVGKKINEVYEFTNTPVMKAVKKQIGLDKADDVVKEFDIDEVFKNMNKLSDEKLKNAANRVENMTKIKKYKENS